MSTLFSARCLERMPWLKANSPPPALPPHRSPAISLQALSKPDLKGNLGVGGIGGVARELAGIGKPTIEAWGFHAAGLQVGE